MPGIGEVINGLMGKESMARQFFVWNVASTIVSQALDPYLTALANDINSKHPEKPLAPPDLADMVVRGVLPHDQGAAQAAKSGVSPGDFDLTVANTGEPPSVIDMLMLMRRGKATRDDVIRAIKQSRVKNEWIDTILELGTQPPTPADILRATLQGQTDLATGHDLYVKLGGDPEYFQLMLDTEGSAPTPNEAATMANRGVIPWSGTGPDVVSFEQAFLEGPWRNKWLEPYRKLSQYYPPPRTITAMHTSGALSDADATRLLKEQGLDDALVAAYLKDSSSTKKVKAKDLAESTVQTLFTSHAISVDQASTFLQQLKYNQDDANFIILAWTMARELSARDKAVNTIHSSYIGHKIDASTASMSLDSLGVPSDQRDYLLKTWTEEKAAKVELLTAAEIKKAMTKNLITSDDALQRLIDRGYSQDDAMLYLSI